jgi:hypothetical protein
MNKGILLNARNHARVAQDEYDDWYETEHLRDASVVLRPAWAKAVDTPWTRKIRPVMRDRIRIVYRPYRRAQARQLA